MSRRFLTRALALSLLLGVAAGCGGRSSKKTVSAATVAPTTSATTSPTSSSTPSPVASGGTTTPGLPDPGGQVAALSSAAPVNATVERGAYQAFRERVSASSFVIPSVPGLTNRAYVVEDDGYLRVIDIAASRPALDRAFALRQGGLGAGVAAGALRIQDASTALVTAAGAGGEAVYVFDPLAARATADVTRFDLTGITVTWAAGTKNSKGVDVGGQPRPLSYTAAALVAGGKLLVASSNLDASFDNDPGTVLAYAYDAARRTVSGPGRVLMTSAFNPTALASASTPQGEVVLCTNTGAMGGEGSIDLIDPVTFTRVGVIPLGTRNPAGPVLVSPDGKRGYVGSQGSAEVYVLDLTDLGRELANAAPADLSARFRGGFELPSRSAMNYVSSLALSHTGNYLYAVSFNESALYAIDLTAPGLAADVRGFARTGDVNRYEGLADFVAVRPGEPGKDFQGASLYVLTIGLATADQAIRDVKVVLDRVTVDRH